MFNQQFFSISQANKNQLNFLKSKENINCPHTQQQQITEILMGRDQCSSIQLLMQTLLKIKSIETGQQPANLL